LTRNRVFLISPSFYALIAGTMLSATIDLFKSLFENRQRMTDWIFVRTGGFAFALLVISTCSFMYLSAMLEQKRLQFTVQKLLSQIEERKELKNRLWVTFVLGFSCVAAALVTVAAGYFYGIF